MGRPLPIPRWLAINWWTLLLVSIVEGLLHWKLHAPQWLPTITGLWYFAQAGWLKIAEPRSNSIYFYVVGLIVSEASALFPVDSHQHILFGVLYSLLLSAVWILAIFLFRAEMERHFTSIDPHGLKLSGAMTFFFSTLYFQYWFHEIYREQNEPDIRITPASA